MPWVTSNEATSSDPADPEITVLFQDLRFLNTTPLLGRGDTTPLTGTVNLTRSGQVVDQGIDGRVEH